MARLLALPEPELTVGVVPPCGDELELVIPGVEGVPGHSELAVCVDRADLDVEAGDTGLRLGFAGLMRCATGMSGCAGLPDCLNPLETVDVLIVP